MMRGTDIQQDTSFSTVSPEQRVPEDHPRHPIRRIIDETLNRLNAELDTLYADVGERLDPAGEAVAGSDSGDSLHYTQRAAVVGKIDYNLLFRWPVGFSMDD